MLEPDTPKATSSIRKTKPTDIADIIDDLIVSEQRFSPSFEFTPNQGPYGPQGPQGRYFRPPAVIPAPQVNPRRPLAAIAPTLPNNNRPQYQQRTPLKPQFEFVDDNSILGSGQFDILTGGVYRDQSNDLQKFNNNYFTTPNNLRQLTPGSSPFTQQPTLPPSNQSPSIYSQQQNHHHNNNPPSNFNPFLNSFFGDDDFFSNFRDFADVNQDYRDVTPDFHDNNHNNNNNNRGRNLYRS